MELDDLSLGRNFRLILNACFLTIFRYSRFTDVVLVFLLLTLNIFLNFSSVSVVDFEQVNVS